MLGNACRIMIRHVVGTLMVPHIYGVRKLMRIYIAGSIANVIKVVIGIEIDILGN